MPCTVLFVVGLVAPIHGFLPSSCLEKSAQRVSITPCKHFGRSRSIIAAQKPGAPPAKGQLSLTAADASIAAREANRIFDAIDANGDGELSLTELRGHLSGGSMMPSSVDRLFESLDTNADGVLSRAEFQQGFTLNESVGLRLALGLPQRQRPDQKALPIHEDARRLLADDLFAVIDTDQKGEISSRALREHLEIMASYSLRTIDGIMNVLDVNQNGKIDQAEMRAAFQRYEYTALRLALGIS